MAQLAVPLMIASTAMTVAGTMRQASAMEAQGEMQAQQAQFEAAQQDQIAGLERASAQRTAEEERRRARLIESRAIALAASQGGSVADPTVVDILGDISAEGEYRARTALFEGEQRATNRELAGRVRRFEGRAAKRGASAAAGGKRFSGIATAIGQGSSLFEKYG